MNAPGSRTKNGRTNAAVTPSATSTYRRQFAPETARWRATGGNTSSENCLNAMAQPNNAAERTNAMRDARVEDGEFAPLANTSATQANTTSADAETSFDPSIAR